MPPSRPHASRSQPLAAPPGRRKSCRECIKGKRRCEMSTSKCSRCSRLGLPCDYKNATGSSSTSEPQSESDFDHFGAENTLDLVNDWASLSNLEVAELGFLDPSPTTSLLLETTPDTPAFSLDQIETQVPASLVTQNSSRDDRGLRWGPTDIPAAGFEDLIIQRMSYTIDQMKLAPYRLVLENETPWSHCCLYENHMPKSMEEAYAACALYTSKNAKNSRYVARHIQNRVTDLLARPAPTTRFENLSRAHALLLYMIMQTFDGSIASHALFDSGLSALEEYATVLSDYTHETINLPRSLPLFPLNSIIPKWESWIFRESARRTHIVALCFISICGLLRRKEPYCKDKPGLRTIFTPSLHLWKATSVFEFAVAWNEKDHKEVLNTEFSDVIANSVPADVCVLGRMLLVAKMGVDNVRGWFCSKGALLDD